MDGFLLINKPAGVTSHDVVAAVRHTLASRFQLPVPRVGHAGTLDPLATGLLIIGVGRATKELGRFSKLPKTYEAEVTLDATSDTDDAEGALRKISNTQLSIPKRDDIARALRSLTGAIEQVPPSYSAVKVGGVPAYRRARRGETVTLKPRRVTVHGATLLAYRFPLLRVRWTVSSGTYIRALARDLGTALGTGAYLRALRRTAIGPILVADALSAAAVSPTTIRTHLRHAL